MLGAADVKIDLLNREPGVRSPQFDPMVQEAIPNITPQCLFKSRQIVVIRAHHL
jgi:hypothetical protein